MYFLKRLCRLRSVYRLLQSENISVAVSLVYHVIHALLNHINTKAADLTLLNGKCDIRIRLCQRIIWHAMVDKSDDHRHRIFFHFYPYRCRTGFRMIGKLGVFLHWWPTAENPDTDKDFDVEGLVCDLKEIKPDFFFFTLGENSGSYNAPNAV